MRGRKPNLVGLHIVRGNPSKLGAAELARRQAAEPQPKVALAPEHIAALKAGDRPKQILLALLTDLPPGFLARVDLGVLLVYATAFTQFQDASAKITADTMIVRDTRKGGFVRNPYLRVERESAELLLRAATAIGCTPAARAALGTKLREDPGDGASAWDEFLASQ